MTPPTFAELLHHHRVARGLTRAQLATRAGVNAAVRSPARPVRPSQSRRAGLLGPEPAAPAGAGPWRRPDFRRLWTSQTLSFLGSEVTLFALPLAAVALGAGPKEMGWLTAARFLPILLLGLVAGAWVDRLPRRPLLIATDLGRAARHPGQRPRRGAHGAPPAGAAVAPLAVGRRPGIRLGTRRLAVLGSSERVAGGSPARRRCDGREPPRIEPSAERGAARRARLPVRVTAPGAVS